VGSEKEGDDTVQHLRDENKYWSPKRTRGETNKPDEGKTNKIYGRRLRTGDPAESSEKGADGLLQERDSKKLRHWHLVVTGRARGVVRANKTTRCTPYITLFHAQSGRRESGKPAKAWHFLDKILSSSLPSRSRRRTRAVHNRINSPATLRNVGSEVGSGNRKVSPKEATMRGQEEPI